MGDSATLDPAQSAPRQAAAGWTRSQRDALQNEGLVKFREVVIRKLIKTPLSKNLTVTSYKPSDMEQQSNFFNAIGAFSQASLQFATWLRTHHVDTVFYLKKNEPTTANDGTVTNHFSSLSGTGDLFELWNTVTLQEVYDSCVIYKRYSNSGIELQNMNLSWEFIMANVDQDMRATIIAKVSCYLMQDSDCAQSGPMAYWVVAKLIQATESLSHKVVSGTMDMGLVHFKGKNVVDAVAVLCNILRFLAHGTAASKAPPTMLDVLVDVFLCCSVPVFVNYIRNLKDFHASDIDTPEKLFDKAQVYYNQLLADGKWVRTTKTRAAFMSESPELAATLEAEALTRPPPKQGGGGRREGGGGQEVDFKGRPIDRTPPKDGKTSRQKPDGYREYWCGKCRDGGRWGSHDDNHHDEWVQKMKDRKNKNKEKKSNGDDAKKDQDKKDESTANPAPSMHRATFCAPLLSVFRGTKSYDSDQSF